MSRDLTIKCNFKNMNLCDRVDFVLVEPSESGNVGSCARVLMNTGFRSFTMVNPKVTDWGRAHKMAVHASLLVENARICKSLVEAIGECSYVVGFSARVRSHPERKSPLGPDEFLERICCLPSCERAALVFGPERTGLTNLELGLCNDVVCLPTANAYTSMNLASCVLVVAWELWRAEHATSPLRVIQRKVVSFSELNELLSHAKRTLDLIGYLDSGNPRIVMDELRTIFARAKLDARELRMFRGIFHCVDVWISRHHGPPTPNELRKHQQGNSIVNSKT
jgi:TrmH family RNA methyltransferase